MTDGRNTVPIALPLSTVGYKVVTLELIVGFVIFFTTEIDNFASTAVEISCTLSLMPT